MKKLLGIVVLGLILNGCGPSVLYSPVRNMTNDSYWIEGLYTKDAFEGAEIHCSKVGGKFSIVKLIPHADGSYFNRDAELIFKCE